MTQEEEAKEPSLSYQFHWSQVNLQAYQLSWDTHNLAGLGADRIAQTVVKADFSNLPTDKTAEFLQGAITLAFPHSNKLCKAHLEAFADQVSV